MPFHSFKSSLVTLKQAQCTRTGIQSFASKLVSPPKVIKCLQTSLSCFNCERINEGFEDRAVPTTCFQKQRFPQHLGRCGAEAGPSPHHVVGCCLCRVWGVLSSEPVNFVTWTLPNPKRNKKTANSNSHPPPPPPSDYRGTGIRGNSRGQTKWSIFQIKKAKL